MAITSLITRLHYISQLAGCLLLLLVIAEKPARAKEFQPMEDSVMFFKARVLNALSREPVIFAHIINSTRSTAAISDTLGYFFIRTSAGDQLQVTAIGFAPRQLKIRDTVLQDPIIHDILLKPIVYSIEAVRVNPLGSYEQFKKRFVTMKLPESVYKINPTVLDEIEQGTDTLDMLIVPPMSPVTALYNLLSKEGKSKRKLRKLLEKEAFERQIAFKYSPDIVSEITGYTGFELYEFMEFCSFKKDFLLDATYYEIVQAILARQQEFEAAREKP